MSSASKWFGARIDWWIPLFCVAGVIAFAGLVAAIATTDTRPHVHPEWVELDRATKGTVLVRPEAVTAILGPGEVVLDDGAGTRHNANTQIVTGGLRINVRGTASEVHRLLRDE